MPNRGIGFEYSFSHEFEDGPSGPARSYWDFYHNGTKLSSSIALLPRQAGNAPSLEAQQICRLLEKAFERGSDSKARLLRAMLGLNT